MFQQKDGTAIVAHYAVGLTNLYVDRPEKQIIIHKFRNNIYFLKQFIVNMIGVWKYDDTPLL